MQHKTGGNGLKKKKEHTLDLGSSVSVTFNSAGRRSCSVPTATEEEEAEAAAESVKGEEMWGERKGWKRWTWGENDESLRELNFKGVVALGLARRKTEFGEKEGLKRRKLVKVRVQSSIVSEHTTHNTQHRACCSDKR